MTICKFLFFATDPNLRICKAMGTSCVLQATANFRLFNTYLKMVQREGVKGHGRENNRNTRRTAWTWYNSTCESQRPISTYIGDKHTFIVVSPSFI